MNEQKEPKIHVDIVAVDTNKLTADRVPDEFWLKMEWFEKYNKRDDLEIRIFKGRDNEAALNRIYSSGKSEPQKTGRGLFDEGDYLSLGTPFFRCFSNYEDCLNSQIVQLLQPGEDKYLLDTINICVYMQRCRGDTASGIPSGLVPLDLKQFSTYKNVVGTILDCAETNDFDGLRCEYIISGRDRCTLGLFIEDSEDRWDGLRYQFNFHISLYQMPGLFSGLVEGREIQHIETKEQYALDCIIASGYKCDTFSDFHKWADAFFFGYRVD